MNEACQRKDDSTNMASPGTYDSVNMASQGTHDSIIVASQDTNDSMNMASHDSMNVASQETHHSRNMASHETKTSGACRAKKPSICAKDPSVSAKEKMCQGVRMNEGLQETHMNVASQGTERSAAWRAEAARQAGVAAYKVLCCTVCCSFLQVCVSVYCSVLQCVSV